MANHDRCRRCHGHDLAIIPGPHPNGHQLKLACSVCGAMVRWLDPPAPCQDDLAMFHRAIRTAESLPGNCGSVLPWLTGSDDEVEAARWIRPNVLRRIHGELGTEAMQAARTIEDARWWIENQGRVAGEIRWPKEWYEGPTETLQMVGPVETDQKTEPLEAAS